MSKFDELIKSIEKVTEGLFVNDGRKDITQDLIGFDPLTGRKNKLKPNINKIGNNRKDINKIQKNIVMI